MPDSLPPEPRATLPASFSLPLKRILFWSLLLCFVVWTAWCCLRFPFDRERLYRAIPVQANFVGEHLDLAGRWAALSKDTAVHSLAQFVGVQDRRADGVLGDPELARLVHRIARRDSLVAYVPALHPAGPPAWVFSTWVGAYGVLLRGELGAGLVKGFQRVRLEGGRQAWRMAKPATRSGWTFSMAVSEGVLVGCLSPDPQGVQSLLDRMEQKAALLPELREWLAVDRDEAASPYFAGAADRCWVRWYGRSDGRPEPRWLRFALGRTAPAFAEGWARGRVGFGLPAPAVHAAALAPATEAAIGSDGTNAWDELDRFLGDAPAAALTVPFGPARAWVAQGRTAPWAQAILDQLAQDVAADSPLVATLCGTNYAGRLFGLRAPTAIFAVPLAGVTNRRAWVAERLDRINSAGGMSLMAMLPAGESGMMVLDHVGAPSFKDLAPGERPALLLLDHWLVLSSSADALAKIMESRRAGGHAAAGGFLPDSPLLPFTSLVLRADLGMAGDALVKAVAVYDLMNYSQGLSARSPGRDAMNAVMTWIESVRSMKRVALEARTEGSELEAFVRLGQGNP